METKIIVKTHTGSVYRIDPKLKFWERLSATPQSGLLRTGFGFYNELDWLFTDAGIRMALTCDPITAGKACRIIQTSPIRVIESAGYESNSRMA